MATALITGASRGIGAAFAEELAQRKMDLILIARSDSDLQALATRLHDRYGVRAEVLVRDLTQPTAAKEVFEAVTQQGLTIDLLVNNAGFGDYGAFAERPGLKQVEMIQLNVTALVELTHLFLPGMRDRRSGSIINVASIAAFQPLPYMSVYAATKAFVVSFSEALWAENQACGVRVLALCPGPTQSNFAQVAEFPEAMMSGDMKAASAEEVVRDALKALEHNESTIVTGGLGNQIIVNLPRFLPRRALVSLVEKQFKFS
jgi:uncharacterized protein